MHLPLFYVDLSLAPRFRSQVELKDRLIGNKRRESAIVGVITPYSAPFRPAPHYNCIAKHKPLYSVALINAPDKHDTRRLIDRATHCAPLSETRGGHGAGRGLSARARGAIYKERTWLCLLLASAPIATACLDPSSRRRTPPPPRPRRVPCSVACTYSPLTAQQSSTNR